MIPPQTNEASSLNVVWIAGNGLPHTSRVETKSTAFSSRKRFSNQVAARPEPPERTNHVASHNLGGNFGVTGSLNFHTQHMHIRLGRIKRREDCTTNHSGTLNGRSLFSEKFSHTYKLYKTIRISHLRIPEAAQSEDAPNPPTGERHSLRR